jgi:hypothetical protein
VIDRTWTLPSGQTVRYQQDGDLARTIFTSWVWTGLGYDDTYVDPAWTAEDAAYYRRVIWQEILAYPEYVL